MNFVKSPQLSIYSLNLLVRREMYRTKHQARASHCVERNLVISVTCISFIFISFHQSQITLRYDSVHGMRERESDEKRGENGNCTHKNSMMWYKGGRWEADIVLIEVDFIPSFYRRKQNYPYRSKFSDDIARFLFIFLFESICKRFLAINSGTLLCSRDINNPHF